MFTPHPSNPLLYKLEYNSKTFYGTYEEICSAIVKLKLNLRDFEYNGFSQWYKYNINSAPKSSQNYICAEIGAPPKTFIKDCINPSCTANYKPLICAALRRLWKLKKQTPSKVLWTALGIKNNFQLAVYLAKYKLTITQIDNHNSN